MGNPIYALSARGIETTISYDALHRPLSQHIKGHDGQEPLDHTISRNLYGESLSDKGAAKANNLRGQIYEHYDPSGLSQVPSYSLHAQALNTSRRLRIAYKTEANWPEEDKSNTVGGANNASTDSGTGKKFFAPTIPAKYADLLQTETFTTTTIYDALGRPISSTDADGNTTQPSYHISGRLAQLEVHHPGDAADASATPYVKTISYNPKSQREKIIYGNGVTTRYTYEPETFRLTRIKSSRFDPQSTSTKTLQDLNYTYDPRQYNPDRRQSLGKHL